MVVDTARLDAVVAALGAATADPRPRYDVVEARGDAAYVGRVGMLSAPLPIGDFASRVGERLAVTPRVAAGDITLADRIAVLPGSGASMLDAAAATGASAFVTGDVAHHQARLANECGLAIVDAEHAPTERPGVARLYAAVAAAVDVAHDMSVIDANPWKAK
jgi:putative NIF3 family GTP cyclohydrolase 1 type 2